MVKKLFFLIAISVGMFFPTMAQNIPSYVPTNGLVGWWPFNGNANDESGNGNNGAVNGATLSVDRNGKSNSAYSFDGINDYLIGNSSQFPASERTISLWINSSFTKEKTFFIGYGGGNCGTSFGIYANTSGCGVQGENAFSYSSHCCNNNFNEPYQQSIINNWNFLVFVTKKDSTFLYLNGKIITSLKLAINITNTQNKNFIFGGLVNTNGLDIYPATFYQGKLDDIAIYNRALTQQEINALYTSTPPCTNPTASITPQGNTTFCQGGFVNLNASTGANYTYQWYNNGQLINGVTASTYQANTSGNYTVKVTDGECSTTSSATTVTVTPYPSSNVQVSGATSFCQGNNVTITSSGVGNYLWSNGATTKSITVTETGNYSVQVTQNGCTSNSSVTSVTVNPNPTASITPQGNTTFCQGGFVNLNASTGANYTYQWYNNGQLINGVTASTYQANTSGNYTVKVTDGECSTTSSATTVTVTPYPSSNVQVSGATSFCQGNNVTITSSGVGNYLWSNGATTKSITVTETGNYSVQVTQNGCTSNSSITSITVNPNPTASITPQGNTTFCQGGFVNLVASGGTSYQWNTGASSSSITANQSGTYVVNVFNSFGCQASASQVVVVNSNPIVAFNGLNDYTLKTQQTIQLIGSPSGGNFVGDGINGTTFNPVNVTLGKKTITYNYTSPQGCKGSATRSTIIVDSVGNVCNVTKYDTVTFTKNITKYDTITITKNVTKYDTITIKNNIYDTVTITNNVTKYDTILKLKFKLTTGINANQMTSMTLYPNPTTDVLYIEIGDAKALDGYRYRILDAVGKEVYNQLVKNPKTEIPLKSLGAAGMYLFEVIDQQNKTIQSNKIVLE